MSKLSEILFNVFFVFLLLLFFSLKVCLYYSEYKQDTANAKLKKEYNCVSIEHKNS